MKILSAFILSFSLLGLGGDPPDQQISVVRYDKTLGMEFSKVSFFYNNSGGFG